MIKDSLSADQMSLRSVRAFASISACCLPLVLLMVINNGTGVLWPWYMALFIAFVSTFVVFKFPKLTQAQCSTIFILLVVSICLAGSINSHYIAILKLNKSIFGSYKICAMFIALIAPTPVWLGYFLISLCILVPPLQALIFSPEVMDIAGLDEPWYTLLYTMPSIFVLKYRLESHSVQTALFEAKTNEKILKDFTNVTLELRDLSMAPLSEQRLLAELLAEEKIDRKQGAERLLQSIKKLDEIVNVLNEHHKKLLVKMNRNQNTTVTDLRSNLAKSKKLNQQLG